MRELWREIGATRATTIIFAAFVIVVAGFFVAWFLPMGSISYSSIGLNGSLAATSTTATVLNASSTLATASTTPPAFVVTHVNTPEPLKGIYMSSWAAGSSKFRPHLFDLVDTTEVNAVRGVKRVVRAVAVRRRKGASRG
jgi:hypothetical protein